MGSGDAALVRAVAVAVGEAEGERVEAGTETDGLGSPLSPTLAARVLPQAEAKSNAVAPTVVLVTRPGIWMLRSLDVPRCVLPRLDV